MIKEIKEKTGSSTFYVHAIGVDANYAMVQYPNSSSELRQELSLQYLIDNNMIGGGGGSAGTWEDIFPEVTPE